MLSKTQFSYLTLQRMRWCVHVIGVLAIASLTYIGWQVQASIQERHARMEQEIEQDRQLLREMKKIEEQLAEALQSRDQISASFRALRDRVPIRLVDSEILKSVEEIVAGCGCKLNDFRPIGSQMIESKELKCRVRSFQLSMDGSYAGLFSLARELDDFPFLIQLKRLHFSAPSNNDGSSRIDLEIGILYAPEWRQSELVSTERDSA